MLSFSELHWYDGSESSGTKKGMEGPAKGERRQQRTQLLHIAFHGVYYFSICFILIFLFGWSNGAMGCEMQYRYPPFYSDFY
jgi:hypothetical protein